MIVNNMTTYFNSAYSHSLICFTMCHFITGQLPSAGLLKLLLWKYRIPSFLSRVLIFAFFTRKNNVIKINSYWTNVHVCTEEKLLQCHQLLTSQERIDIPLTGLESITGHAYTFIKGGILAPWQLKTMLKWYYS